MHYFVQFNYCHKQTVRLKFFHITYRRITSKDRLISSYLKITCYHYTAEDIQDIKFCLQRDTESNNKKIPFRIIIWFARKKSGDVSPSLTSNSLNLQKKKDTPFIQTEPTLLPSPTAGATTHSSTCSDKENTFHQKNFSHNLLIFLTGSYMVNVKKIHSNI